MNSILKFVLIIIFFISCSKNDIAIVKNENIKQDTLFSISMQKCPDLQSTCFLVNANESMMLEVKWEAMTNLFFTDTIKINKGNQLIYTKKMYYKECPFVYKKI